MMNKTVDNVLKTFNKALSDLDVIKTKKNVEVTELSTKLTAAEEERDRATRVAKKLEDLLE